MLLFHQSEKHEFNKKLLIHQYKVITDEALMFIINQKSIFCQHNLQPADIGWPAGNGNKLSCSQAQLGQATCLAVA